MYTDRVDLNLIDPARSGLSEVESLTFTGRVNPAIYEEAMELYQIGINSWIISFFSFFEMF